MKNKKSVPLQAVYAIFLEEPDDYYLHPRGVLFVDTQQNATLFCSDADHNFLLKTIRKFSYKDLEQGVEFNGFHFELKNLTADMLGKYGDSPGIVPLVLKELYKTSPRQYSFLQKALDDGRISFRFAP